MSRINSKKRKAEPYDPWERRTKASSFTLDDMTYATNYGLSRPKFHVHSGKLYLDIGTKKAALRASPSIVSLVSYSEDDEDERCRSSIADPVNVEPGSFVVEFGEKRIRSFLELLEMMWDNVGNHVKLVVVRDSEVFLCRLAW